jgi:VWFA-related protein
MVLRVDPAGVRRPGRVIVTAVAALVVAAAVLRSAPAAQHRRTVHVTVVGDKGDPIEGLSPEDFVLKEDGKTRPVVEAAPATETLSVALLIDDRGSDINEIRAALAAFVARVQDRAEVALVSVVPTTTTVFDYTSSGPTMQAGIRRLVWRPGQAAGLVLGAVADAADGLRRREAARPAIVVVTFEGAEFKSHRRAQDVLASLGRSRAALHVVAVGTPTLRRMNRAVVESGDAQGDEWTVDENNRNAVLGEGPRQSGGRRHELTVATGLTRALEAVASDLLNQYTIVYETAGEPGSRKLSVSVKRRGVTIRAPSKTSG